MDWRKSPNAERAGGRMPQASVRVSADALSGDVLAGDVLAGDELAGDVLAG
jgi:hypothetical protein